MADPLERVVFQREAQLVNFAVAGESRENIRAIPIFTSARFVFVPQPPKERSAIPYAAIVGGPILGTVVGTAIDSLIRNLWRSQNSSDTASRLTKCEIDDLVATGHAIATGFADSSIHVWTEKKDFVDSLFGEKGCFIDVEGQFQIAASKFVAIASIDFPIQALKFLEQLKQAKDARIQVHERAIGPFGHEAELLKMHMHLSGS